MQTMRSVLVLGISAMLLSCDQPAGTDFTPSADGDPTAMGTFDGEVFFPFGVSSMLRLTGKPTVKSISVSPSELATIFSTNGEIGFVCQKIATGVLWVYYSIYDDPFSEYYNLTCNGVAIRPVVADTFNISEYFRNAGGAIATAISVAPPRLAMPITVDGKGPIAEKRADAVQDIWTGQIVGLPELISATQVATDSDIALVCNEAGEGILTVSFAPESGLTSGTYDLICRRHDQGGGG
jgi:hypothetical protein